MSKKLYRPADLLRDHARPRHAPTPTDVALDERLTEIIQPATYAVIAHYHRLGLRERVLTLPVMVCVLVTLVWRQVPGVRPLARMLSREQLFWTPPTKVTHEAVNLRLRSLPPCLLRDVVYGILPDLARRAAARTRPRPAVITRVQAAFPTVWAVDATTLEALFKKVGLLKGLPQTVYGGKLLGVLDVATKLPVQLAFDEDATVNERHLFAMIKNWLSPGVLLLLDKGFFGFEFFDWCTERGIAFIIPDRVTTVDRETTVLASRGALRDERVLLGRYRSSPCRHPVRRVTLTVAGKRYAYLTNVCEPERLAAGDVVQLYRLRWRIEEALLLTKRLLGLSYLWTGAMNGVALQIWATWLLYAILVDLSDAVADVLDLPLDRISLEMTFRSLYFYVGAASRGETDDPVTYLASQTDLGIIKRPRGPTAIDKALRALT